jgi:hypothetical protein
VSNTHILVTKYFYIALTGKQMGVASTKGQADSTAAAVERVLLQAHPELQLSGSGVFGGRTV